MWNRTRSGPRPDRNKPPTAADRRVADRKRQRLIDGFIAIGEMPPRPCRIIDTSATGSKVELWGDFGRPLRPGDRLTLYIPADRQEIDAEVVWRTSNAMGMRFTSEYREPTRAYN